MRQAATFYATTRGWQRQVEDGIGRADDGFGVLKTAGEPSLAMGQGAGHALAPARGRMSQQLLT